MSSTVVGASAQSTEVQIELTGVRTNIPGNLVSKSLYKYHCIHKTSLGPLILDATISKWVQNNIRVIEHFDFCMHYVGCPALIVLLICSQSAGAWGVAIFFFTLHLATLVWAFIFFVVPLDRAKNLALMVPTKSSENINNFMNEFIKITASQTSAYALTDFQAAIFAKASIDVEINMMVYNNKWSLEYNHLAGYWNVFIHIMPFLLMTSGGSFGVLFGLAVAGYICGYLTWRVLKFTSFEPLCWDWLCFYLCLLTICAPVENTILDRIQSGHAQSATSLTYIRGNRCTDYI